ncbi:hypothetical protein L682_19530 [Aquipseudomonas alcaligenes OT 69]|nr:hypothetical protein L682_19530 [Pseudomonas alcaligenes OT 69]
MERAIGLGASGDAGFAVQAVWRGGRCIAGVDAGGC